ncbi:MAG: right-handed parallel beta-helix repeat-containing protein [Candidatus Bathyarchaeia archaeon]|jgi:hypothetical protein
MKRLACTILIVTILVSGLLAVQNVHAQTGIETLTTNTEWTTSMSPINFNESMMISSGVTLTIDPGVTVNLGMYSLMVYGTLTAQGATNNQITLTDSTNVGNQTLQNGVIATIVFFPSSTPWNPATNSGSIIQNAVLDGVNVEMSSASPEIDSSLFNYANPSIPPISNNGGSPIISNNVIDYNTQGSFSGVDSIAVYGGTPQITSDQFEGAFSGSSNNGVYVSSGTPMISDNTFGAAYGNNSVGVNVISGNPTITNNQMNGNGYLTGVLDASTTPFMISNNVFSSCLSGVTAQAGSVLTIEGNQFLRGNDGIDIADQATLTITGNLIDGNSRFGISGGGTINSNTITNNQVGIHNPTTGTINENNIVANTVNSIQTTVENINAQDNWWGTTDTATINQTIYDTKADPRLGTVTFVPFLTQPSPSAPAIPSYTPTITPIPTTLLTPSPTAVPVDATPTPTPVPYTQSFAYQVGSLINWNLITTAVAVIMALVWAIVVLGYAAKSGISKYKAKN